MLGPFYEPGAPLRTSVGSGYVLSGTVLAAQECQPICKAHIEFWLANPRGNYDDAHRATVFAGERGRYRLESNVPVSYGGRPPHIHVRTAVPVSIDPYALVEAIGRALRAVTPEDAASFFAHAGYRPQDQPL